MRIILLLLLVFVISGCVSSAVIINDVSVSVNVVDTFEERQKGMMFREELCDTCGMLFVFENDYEHSFWMKNTLIPLDMLFINNDYVIVDILEAEPCVQDLCEAYTPEAPARYVLETNKGFSKDHGIAVGDRVRLQSI